MTDGSRDLACVDVWDESLARSRARRGLAPLGTSGVPVRDLTDPEFWTDSRSRSMRKRQWRERTLNFGPIDSKRIAVPAALLAGGLAVTEVVGSSGGGGGSATAGTLPQDNVAGVAASTHQKQRQKQKQSQKAESRKRKAGASSVPRAKPKPKPVIRSVAEAQSLGGFKSGMKGPGVAQLQRQLGVTADGIYGPATLHAVHVLQRRQGLHTDGIVGPATWKAIQSPRSSSTTRTAVHRSKRHSSSGKPATLRTSTAKVLARGGEVESLQAKLGLPVDGDYGARTTAAVKRFQRRHGLTADGVVGAATWGALGLSSSNRTLHPHNFGTKRLQSRATSGSSDTSGSSGGSGGGGSNDTGVVARAIAAANAIAGKPYRYGGGHGSFDDTGYDCSGSVSYVLHGAGLLASPIDSSGFMSYGEAGPGQHITIYANPGHVFMTIDGRRFDTGYGGNGDRWASGSRPTGGFVVRHPPGL